MTEPPGAFCDPSPRPADPESTSEKEVPLVARAKSPPSTLTTNASVTSSMKPQGGIARFCSKTQTPWTKISPISLAGTLAFSPGKSKKMCVQIKVRGPNLLVPFRTVYHSHSIASAQPDRAWVSPLSERNFDFRGTRHLPSTTPEINILWLVRIQPSFFP